MKPLSRLLSWICVGTLSSSAQTPPAPATLFGFVNLPGYKCAILSVANPRPGWRPTELILREGERANSIELLHIIPEYGTVELRVGGSNLVAALPGDAINAPSGVPAIAFAGVSLKSALEIYAELSGRSLLRSPALRNLALTFRTPAGDKAEAAKLLSDAFSTNGIAVIPDGDKFALVLAKSDVPLFHPSSAEISAAAKNVAADQIIKPGWVILDGADLLSVARTYAELSGRKINPAEWSPSVPQQANFFFKNQTALTKAEMLYAYEMLFHLYGLKMIPKGDEFLEPVPVSGR